MSFNSVRFSMWNERKKEEGLKWMKQRVSTTRVTNMLFFVCMTIDPCYRTQIHTKNNTTRHYTTLKFYTTLQDQSHLVSPPTFSTCRVASIRRAPSVIRCMTCSASKQ